MAFKDFFKEFQNLNVGDKYVLRQVRLEKDMDAYFESYSDEHVFKYYGTGNTCKNRDTLYKVLSNQINEFEKARVYSWTITDAENDFAIGRILLSNFECNNKIANIGYFINRSYWGKGIISSCINSVIKFGFEYLKLERIYTRVAIENTGSQYGIKCVWRMFIWVFYLTVYTQGFLLKTSKKWYHITGIYWALKLIGMEDRL